VNDRPKSDDRDSAKNSAASDAGQVLESLLDELEQDLESQAIDGIALPAWICRDRDGQPLTRNVLALNRRGDPLSDADVAALIDKTAEPGARFHGLVRVDQGLPRIVVWDNEGGLAVTSRPRFRHHRIAAFERKWSQALDGHRGLEESDDPQAAFDSGHTLAPAIALIPGLLSEATQATVRTLSQAALDQLEDRLERLRPAEPLASFTVALRPDQTEPDIQALTQPPRTLSTGPLLIALANLIDKLDVDGMVVVFAADAGGVETVHIFGLDPRTTTAFLAVAPLERSLAGVQLGSVEQVPAAMLMDMLDDYLQAATA